MRKGKLALVIYILGVIATGVSALLCYLAAINNPDAGMDNLGFVILAAVALLGLGACVLLLILRILHFISGWKIFPFISTISLISAICTIGSALSDVYNGGIEITTFLVVGAIFILPPVLALISEIRALAN